MIILPMPKDGNCLFHALASFFEHADIRHDTLRQMLVHYIYQNGDQFLTDVVAEGYSDMDHYCENMARDKYWGDGTILQAFAVMFKVNVYVYYKDEKTPTCLRHFKGRPTLGLLLNGNATRKRRQRPIKMPMHLLALFILICFPVSIV